MKNIKRSTIAIIITVSLLSLFPAPASALTGSGTETDPYRIRSLGDFNEFCVDADYWDDYTRLETDINLASIIYTTAPIAPDNNGTNSQYIFDGTTYTGIFDGNNHIISNLTIDTAGVDNDYLGLFGKLDSGGCIANLGIENVHITTTGNYIGGLLGYNNQGDIINCYTIAQISNRRYVGGLVGINYGRIVDSYSTGQVSGYYYVGGLCGWNAEGIIKNCFANGSVTGDKYLGGLCGQNEEKAIIINCYSTSDVNGLSDYVGGMVGYNHYGIITSCYSTGTATGNGYVGGMVGCNYYSSYLNNCYSTGNVIGSSYVGGLVGYNMDIITNCYSIGNVTGSANVGGLVGYRSTSGNLINSFWDVNTSGIGNPGDDNYGATGKTTLQMRDVNTFLNAAWDFIEESANGTSQVWQMPTAGGYPELSYLSGYIPVELNGDGNQANPYLIGNALELGAINHYSDSACYKLIADVNLSDTQWYSAVIPYFSGHFDGDGYKIQNLSIYGGDILGLFAELSNSAAVSNLGIENISITGTCDIAGGLVSYNYGSITNCYSTGHISYISSTGGLVSHNYGNINSCYSTVEVHGYFAGGLVRFNRGGVNNCYYSGQVSGNEDAGGLVSYNQGSISNCSSTGQVSSTRYLGGLVGKNYTCITNCFSTAAVDGFDCVGGLVGDNHGNITNCYSTGQIDCIDDLFGGLIGRNNSESIIDCFWDVNTSGIGSAGDDNYGATGKTTLQMQDINTFLTAGWDFVEESANGTSQVWQMPVAGSCPELSYLSGYIPVVLSGDGSQANPYLIGNALELGAINHYDTSACYKLTSDIDLTGIQWSSAVSPYFSGRFDGDDHIIHNLHIDGGGFLGLFSWFDKNAIVKNIGIENSLIEGSGSFVGPLVSINYGSITSCYSTGSVSSYNYGGGLIGFCLDGHTTRSYSTTDVNCLDDYVGGLIGSNESGSITNCYATGSISGNSNVGGLTGNSRLGIITSCYATGQVSGSNWSTGGLVGANNQMNIITDSYSTGQISGNDRVGGLVGSNSSDSIITKSYSTGQVSGNVNISGLCGYNSDSTISNCVWDINTSGVTIGYNLDSSNPGTVINVVGKTTTEMQTESTFTDFLWDFDTPVWRICEGTNYPKLEWQKALLGDFVCPDGVEINDLAFFTSQWLQLGAYTDIAPQPEPDGEVNFLDFAILAENWLKGTD